MNLKLLSITAIAVIFASIFIIYPSNAVYDPLRLPQSIIYLEATNGTQSYFNIKLSGVPTGYDVTNGLYNGWCIDRRAELARSPAVHTVRLYSSLNPPGDLTDEKWCIVNYILNHKQGNAQDMQEAIWYFINLNGGYSPKSSIAWDIIRNAETGGQGFLPQPGQIAAVIAYPVHITNPNEVQISILEVIIPTWMSIPPPQESPNPSPSPSPQESPVSETTQPTPSPQESPSPTLSPQPAAPPTSQEPGQPSTPTSTPPISPKPEEQNASSPTPDNTGEPQEISLYIVSIIVMLIALLTGLLLIRRKHKK